MTRMDVAAWVTSRTGKYSQFPDALDPAQSHQCVALFYDYTQNVNTAEPHTQGNGADLWLYPWTSYDRINLIETPVYGDWASWSGTSGAYPNGGAGHIAMWAKPYNATSGYFFTQNPGTAGLVLLQYAGIQGYLRMRATPLSLNVIDISRYQQGINIAATGADGVIVGVTFGTAGANPYAGEQLDAVNAAGKLRGAYHIRAGDGPSAQAEADSFLASMAGRMDGRTVLILDWEECTLSDTGWALAWLDYVYAKTGIRPIIYMSSSVSLSYDWTAVMANYGLWVAQYPYNTVTGFVGVNWTPPATSWPALVGWQYAGTGGSVGGYTGIDLSVFYITAAQWLQYAAPSLSGQSSKVTPIEEDMPLTAADVALIFNHPFDRSDGKGPITLASMLAYYPGDIAGIKANVSSVGTAVANVGSSVSSKAATTQAAVSDVKASVATVHTALANVPAAVLNQPFTTAAGVSTNVPGLLDAINTKPVGVVALTSDQVSQLAATLKAELPTATLSALAAKLAA